MLAWAAWQLQYTAHILGTFRKHFAKPSEQVAAPDCTYLEGEDELGGRAESAEECVAHAPPEARGGVDAAEEQALPVHAHQRARQQRWGVCNAREERDSRNLSIEHMDGVTWQKCYNILERCSIPSKGSNYGMKGCIIIGSVHTLL